MTQHIWRDIHDRHVEGPFIQTRPERGVAFFRRAAPCSRCDGRGFVRIGINDRTCPRCDGFRQVTQLRRAFTKPLVHAIRVRGLRMNLARQNRQADHLIAQMARFEEENAEELAILRDENYQRVSREISRLARTVEDQRFITDDQRRRVWSLRDEAEQERERELERIREQEERRRRQQRELQNRRVRRAAIESAEGYRLRDADHIGHPGERHTIRGRVIMRNSFMGLTLVETDDGNRVEYTGRARSMQEASAGDRITFDAAIERHTIAPTHGRNAQNGGTFSMHLTQRPLTMVQRPTRVHIEEGSRDAIPGALGEESYDWAVTYLRERDMLTEDMLETHDE